MPTSARQNMLFYGNVRRIRNFYRADVGIGPYESQKIAHSANSIRQIFNGRKKAICTAYRALGKPDSTAARRAFGRWKRNDSMHNETTSFSGASALFRSPASLFCILFSDKPEKSMSAKRYRTIWVQKGGCNAIPASISRRAVGPQSH